MLVGIETKSVSELYHDNHVHEENDKTMQDLFSSLETPMRNAFYQLVQSLRQRSLAQNSGVKNDNDGVYANNPFQHCNENAFLHSASLSQQTPFISSSPLIATATSKQLCTHASTLTNLGPDKTVTVDSPVVVDAGQVFDGKGATFVPTKNIGDGSGYEFQQ